QTGPNPFLLCRANKTMTALSVSLNDVDVTCIGLLGYWKKVPGWLAASLARCLDQDPQALIHQCYKTYLLGLLESALRRLGRWDSLPSQISASVRRTNLVTEVVNATYWNEGRDIAYVCQQLGVNSVCLKGFAASILCYDEPWERSFHDLDLL